MSQYTSSARTPSVVSLLLCVLCDSLLPVYYPASVKPKQEADLP
jgi:hypothetical protein